LPFSFCHGAKPGFEGDEESLGVEFVGVFIIGIERRVTLDAGRIGDT